MLSTPVSLFPRIDQCLNVWTLERLSYIFKTTRFNYRVTLLLVTMETQKVLNTGWRRYEFIWNFFSKTWNEYSHHRTFLNFIRDPVVAHPDHYCNIQPVLQQSCFSWPLANAVKNGTQFYDTAIKTPTKGYVNDHSLTSLVGWQTVSLCLERKTRRYVVTSIEKGTNVM